MSKGIILYQSKYGATKKYAQWLHEETGFNLLETKSASIKQVREYDTIILGGGVYASGIAGLSFLKKNIEKYLEKVMPFENTINVTIDSGVFGIRKL